MAKQWIANTDGKEVWAIDAKSGTRIRFLRGEEWKVTSAYASGTEVVINYENGRSRTWNPETGSTRLFI